jgi:hypothetical protein
VAPTSRPVAFVKLHRIHATPQATRVEFGAELGGMTWRGDGSPSFGAAKEAVAYRLAICWNVLEGVPNAKLESGWVRDLCQAVTDGDLAKARSLVDAVTDQVDVTNGRAHDCADCIGPADGPHDQPDDDIDDDFPQFGA